MSCLPSYKLLPVIYQLAARMSSLNSDPFQDILQEVCVCVCTVTTVLGTYEYVCMHVYLYRNWVHNVCVCQSEYSIHVYVLM